MGAYLSLEPTVRARVDAALKLSLVARLTPTTRNALLEGAQLRRYRPGPIVVHGRGGLGGIAISGTLRVFDADDPDDSGLTHRNPGPGQALGIGALLDLDDYVGIEALTSAEVLVLDLGVVARLRSEDPKLHTELVRELIQRYRDLSKEYRIFRRGSVEQRLVRELLDRVAAEPGGALIVIHATNQQLAQPIGARREAVNRALNALARDGYLKLGRGRVRIVDLMGLRSQLDS